MKIILTGASGLLGSAFARSAKRRGHEVLGIVGSSPHAIDGLAETRLMDLRDLEAVERLVLGYFPDAIVNCAAVSDVTACEREKEDSARINVELPEKLALLARHFFAAFIHVSSEQVYDGHADCYGVYSPVNPTNEYARQKLESENRVHKLAAEFATTLRLPLLTGNSPSGERSFHERLMQSWENGTATPLFTDEIRQPCLADNAAEAMLELCERSDLKGVYNWAGEDALTRYEMGKAVIEHFGLPESLIEASTRGVDPRFATRQPRLTFDLTSLSGKLKTRPLPFAHQLDALIVPKPRRAWYNSI